MGKKIKMYKTDNPVELNKNRVIHDPAIINYLFSLDVPIYIIRERNNVDNYFAIAGEDVTDKLNDYRGKYGR